MKRLMMLGAPGAGKGTQAEKLAKWLAIDHISTGQIFRDNIRLKTELGQRAQRYIDNGDLVPDSLTNQLVADFLSDPRCAQGFILDGYPRTVDQAHALTEFLTQHHTQLDAVIDIDVDEAQIIERLLKRATLENRPDDTREVIAHRIEIYKSETEPLLDYYAQRGMLITIDGQGTIDEVWQRIQAALA